MASPPKSQSFANIAQQTDGLLINTIESLLNSENIQKTYNSDQIPIPLRYCIAHKLLSCFPDELLTVLLPVLLNNARSCYSGLCTKIRVDEIRGDRQLVVLEIYNESNQVNSTELIRQNSYQNSIYPRLQHHSGSSMTGILNTSDEVKYLHPITSHGSSASSMQVNVMNNSIYDNQKVFQLQQDFLDTSPSNCTTLVRPKQLNINNQQCMTKNISQNSKFSDPCLPNLTARPLIPPNLNSLASNLSSSDQVQTILRLDTKVSESRSVSIEKQISDAGTSISSSSGSTGRNHNKQLLLTDPEYSKIVSFDKETNAFTCNKCEPPKTYAKSYHNIAIIKHVNSAHLHIKEKPKNIVKCSYGTCNKVCNSVKILREHMMIHNDVKERCDYCSFENRKKDRIRDHKKKSHPNEFAEEENVKKVELQKRKLRNAEGRRIRARDTARLKRGFKKKDEDGTDPPADVPELNLTSLAPGGPLTNNLANNKNSSMRIVPNTSKKFKNDRKSSELSLKVSRGS